MAHDLRFRQVHLDFHTSEHIPGIGSEFDPEKFVSALKSAHVDSVTLFSRCHHGWIYHDTKFGIKHPHLTGNLLGDQIRACHSADIRCPIYITVGWDDRVAREQPGWIEVNQEGKVNGSRPLEPGWNKLCFASPYMDFVNEQTEEVFDIFGDEVDGIFFDIIFVQDVHSQWALAEYAKLGWDPSSVADQARMRHHLINQTVERLTATVRAKSKDCSLFFNSGHVSPEMKGLIKAHYSHLEVESLPTGGWGYNHFPIAARYSRVHGKQYLGMTGKFGETWGHFNSYKPPVALEYETRLMLALGGRCSVGDQLHPGGALDESTYELIGSAYSQIEELEPWHRDAKPVVDIAVVHAETYAKDSHRTPGSNVGAYRLLSEGRHQFDFIDEDGDLDDYRVVILTDIVAPGKEFVDRLNHWVKRGGSLILSGDSGKGSGIEGLPAAWGDEPSHHPLFIQTSPSVDAELSRRLFVVYSANAGLVPQPDSVVLAEFHKPYFNRTYRHFCSHNHAPVEGASGLPALVTKGKVAQFATHIFAEYADHPSLEVKQLFHRVLDSLLASPFIRVPGPSSLQAHALSSNGEAIVHLMHYIPEVRGSRQHIVEDRLPVWGSTLDVRGDYSQAVLLPSQAELSVRHRDGRTFVDFPAFEGSQVILLRP